MMFKTGQKVRVVRWADMPQEVTEIYDENMRRIGEVGTIVRIKKAVMHINFYGVIFEDDIYPIWLFEKEIETLVKIGEQLMLFEI